jgi:hypothetical protein
MRKDYQLSTRFTKKDGEALVAKAEELGVPVGFLIRYAVRRMMANGEAPKQSDDFLGQQ